jgi:hypothetical protein
MHCAAINSKRVEFFCNSISFRSRTSVNVNKSPVFDFHYIMSLSQKTDGHMRRNFRGRFANDVFHDVSLFPCFGYPYPRIMKGRKQAQNDRINEKSACIRIHSFQSPVSGYTRSNRLYPDTLVPNRQGNAVQ